MLNMKVLPLGSVVVIGFFKRRYYRVEEYGLREVDINHKEDK